MPKFIQSAKVSGIARTRDRKEKEIGRIVKKRRRKIKIYL